MASSKDGWRERGQRVRADFWRHAGAIASAPPAEPPWAKMAICGAATAVPLIIGMARGEIGASIYAGLAGYLVALNDHLGGWRHRLLVATVSALVISLGLVIGILLHPYPEAYVGLMAAAVYLLGLFGGKGAEVERLGLFMMIELVIAFYARSLQPSIIPHVLSYTAVSYGLVVVGTVVSAMTLRRAPDPHAELLPSLRTAATRSPHRHLYAAWYLLAVMASVLVAYFFEIERGYWIVVTTLLILKPDRRESLYRSVQRLFGTLVGVAVGEIGIRLVPGVAEQIGGVFLCAFIIPYVWKRNYWLLTFCTTCMVLMLLSLPSAGTIDAHTPYVRLKATFFGCLIGISVVALAQSVDVARGRWKRRLAQERLQ